MKPCCVKIVRNANKTRTGANRQEGRTQTQGKGESIREPDQFAERAAGDQARRTGKTTRRGRCHLARWPLFIVIVIFGLAVLYRYGPSRREPRWQWISVGSAFAAVAWLVSSALLSWYLGSFA